MKSTTPPARKLLEHILLARRVEDDSLCLSDEVLSAALDGTRPLSASERSALQHSPLTLRRFRTLSIARKSPRAAANDDAWSESSGMLRAASDGAALSALRTDDGHWHLHFVAQDDQWRVILALSAAAPFAARVLREQPLLRVVDGGGAVLLQGRLDSDGECESAWAFASSPGDHLQQFGAQFAVQAVHQAGP